VSERDYYWSQYYRWKREQLHLVIFVATDGTAYLSTDWAKLLRQKFLPRNPAKPPRRKSTARIKRAVPVAKPTHEAPRSVQ
jgi:hypothetical protein